MTDRTYTILAARIPELEQRLAKLNRRADKLGCPRVSFTLSPERFIPARAQRPYENPADVPTLAVHDVEIVGAGPRIAGYRFVGTLDHTTLPGSVVVQSVPGETVPGEFFTCAPVCAHCGKVRRRTETFVLLHEETGAHKQVGRNCIRDFFGHDPTAILQLLTRIREFLGDLDDEGWSSGGGYRDYSYDPQRALELTAAVIRTLGWVPKSACEFGDKVPTSSHVSYLLDPPDFDSASREAYRRFRDSIAFDAERDTAEAKAAIEWLAQQPDDVTNSYLHNLHALSKAERIPAKLIGYWVSLLSSYLRAQERLQLQRSQQKLNEWTGTVGVRSSFVATCVALNSIDTDFGCSTIHRFLTDEGHTLTWFATGGRKADIGTKYTVVASVKRHDEYKGWKQTTITRAKLTEVARDS